MVPVGAVILGGSVLFVCQPPNTAVTNCASRRVDADGDAGDVGTTPGMGSGVEECGLE